ncbi:hypothetical protein D3C73_1485030 [compost metagenome]
MSLIVTRQIHHLDTDRSVIEIAEIVPLADSGVPCPLLFIDKTENPLIREPGLGVGGVGHVGDQVMSADVGTGQCCDRT